MRLNMTTCSFTSLSFFLLFPLFVISQNVAKNIEEVTPLKVGEYIPKAEIITYHGKTVNIRDVIANKKTLLVMYRGGWCPFCTAYLMEVQSIEREIIDMGYQIAAVSPQVIIKGRDIVDRLDLSYDIYADPSVGLIKSMGLAYTPTKGYEKRKGNKNRDKQKTKNVILPAPALYAVDPSGKILFYHVSISYKNRIKSDMLIAKLKNL